MAASSSGIAALAGMPQQIAEHLLVIGGNRLELLVAEVQEERDGLLHLVSLILGIAMLGLLAAMALTAAVVLVLWSLGPVLILLILAAVFAALGLVLYRLFILRSRTWSMFEASIEQLRRDRDCLVAGLA